MSIEHILSPEAAKEKTPAEKLLAKISEIADEMKKRGLQQDASMVEKFNTRFDAYKATLRSNSEKLRKRTQGVQEWEERRISVKDVALHTEGYTRSIPVTYQLGESGGMIYKPGLPGGWRAPHFEDKAYLEENADYIRRRVEAGEEVINFTFSPEGEREFYRAVGVLHEGQDVADIPKIWESKLKQAAALRGSHPETVNPRDYEAHLPTNIEGVNLIIKKGAHPGSSRKREEAIALELEDNFAQALLEQEG